MNLSLRLICFALLLALLLSRAPAADSGVITGKVTDTEGKPIAGATVQLSRFGELKPTATVATDKSGQFRAEKLSPGKWTLAWKAKGYSEKYETTGGWPSFRVPTTVVVAPGDSKSITLVMRPNAFLYGRVTDTNGRPITNQPVWLVAAPSNHGQPIHPKVMCDGRGFYELEFGDAREPGFGLHVPGRSGYGPFTEFTLEDGKRTRVDFQLVRGASVSGRVLAADGKTPVAGASVGTPQPDSATSHPFRAWVQNNWLNVEWLYAAETNADGCFLLLLNPGVEYTLHAYSKTHMSVYEEDPKVRLRDGEHRNGFRLLLKDGFL